MSQSDDDHDEHGDAASVVAIGIDMREREVGNGGDDEKSW